MKKIFLFTVLLLAFSLLCNVPPQVSNVIVEQRNDGSFFVDVYYDLEDADGDDMLIIIEASDDEGDSWDFLIASLEGDLGTDIVSGINKHIIWDFAADHPEVMNIPTMIKITADDRNVINIEGMVYVEGGSFNNGTSDVTVSSFYISPYEVTQSEYGDIMGNNPAYFNEVTNGPVEWVSWFNAIEYCNMKSLEDNLTPCYSYGSFGTNPSIWPTGWNELWTNHTNISCNWAVNGYRLPTEAEWHYAALGGNQTHNYTYSGSNNIDGVAWYVYNSDNTTHSVGTKTANELDAFDMSGNVWEWVWDIYGDYPGGAQSDPHGAANGFYRTRRGGSWGDTDSYCAVSHRGYDHATDNNNWVGFRICRINP